MLIRLEGRLPAITRDLHSSSHFLIHSMRPTTLFTPPRLASLHLVLCLPTPNLILHSSTITPSSWVLITEFREQRTQRIRERTAMMEKQTEIGKPSPFPHPDWWRLLIIVVCSLFPPWSNIGSTNLKTCAEPNWRVEPGRSTVVSLMRCPSTKVSASGPCGVTVTIPSLCMRLQWWGRIPGPRSWRQKVSSSDQRHCTRTHRLKLYVKVRFCW